MLLSAYMRFDTKMVRMLFVAMTAGPLKNQGHLFGKIYVLCLSIWLLEISTLISLTQTVSVPDVSSIPAGSEWYISYEKTMNSVSKMANLGGY